MLESNVALTAFVLFAIFVLAFELVTCKKYNLAGKVANFATIIVLLAFLFFQLWWPYMAVVLIAQSLLYWLPLKKQRDKKMTIPYFLMALAAASVVYYGVYGVMYLLNTL